MMHRKFSDNRIEELALKRLNGTITAREEKELADWLAEDDGRPLEVPVEFASSREALERRMWHRLSQQSRPAIRRIRRRQWMAAASVLLVVIAGAMSYWGVFRKSQDADPVASHIETPPAEYIKHITLPDGSQVVLHANSNLEYRVVGDRRKVILSGEAYFDIVKNDKLPFVIYTGDITTTVVGTAFNIKAYPGQPEIVVSVTRGRVKVESRKKLLAELTKDEQIRYHNPAKRAVRELVRAETIVTDWTKQDMIFEDVPFGDVAETLERRYGVDIRFTHPDVGNCPVRASFNGTEPVERVIKILCSVLGDQYTVVGKNAYLIDGESCH